MHMNHLSSNQQNQRNNVPTEVKIRTTRKKGYAERLNRIKRRRPSFLLDWTRYLQKI